ncbi:hypothetical protein [Nonomuraea guangzhouensis]|uniref:Mce-associated membrane protein n=1 Tax=Nonomuraea guangzhouensis TaxID=1291555 RepID=A0ABW4GBY4_9ACTN|nr:hypothetical protein [Nonomuraea guangzhouensis]
MTTKQDLAAEEATAAEPPPTSDAPTERPSGSTAPDAPAPDGSAPDRPTSDAPAADGATPEGGASEPGRLGRARIMVVMAALLVAALAATAALQWISASQARDSLARLESERALRLEVSGAASAFGKALLSYDYQDLQATRATLTAQATGDFLATYDEAFGGAMAQVIVKLKAVSQANVREVYLSDVDEATAHAIVVVDQQVNTSEAIRSVKDSHLKISLVKEKGVWKVHDVSVLGAAKEDQYKLDSGSKKKD